MTSFTIASDLELTVDDAGSGPPVLVVHGGGGPATVAPISGRLAATHRVLTPTLPGWEGTPRPDRIASIPDVAATLSQLLAREELHDVLVVGSSIGGWIAAEMALADAERRIRAIVLVDAVGIDVPGQPIADVFALDARGLAERAFHDAERFFVDPATLPPERLSAMQANLATLRVIAGEMRDPTLRARLAAVAVPTLVVWGQSDDIVSPDYGRAYATALSDARFELVAEAGHLPQIEQPEITMSEIEAFAAEHHGAHSDAS